MKYDIRFTNQFNKDLKLAIRQHKDTQILLEVINMLADGQSLDAKYKDHLLIGKFNGCRECHIEPDWILIYQIFNDTLILVLNRVGTHSELFKK